MPASDLKPGSRLGKYRILAHIATGGMGAVYKAQDEVLGRIVALKVLAVDVTARPNALERFQREARYAARLSHKNIVTLYDSGEVDGVHYLAMEFVEGIDLFEYICRKGPLQPEEARRILVQAAKALDHAFQQGIIHRDIKPSNFLLTNEEGRLRVKLTDMGLAQKNSDAEARVTRAGSTVGTVDYLSPEQARDSSTADARSDIYSLGCTFYHMLAGQPPFPDGGLGERILKHLEAEPPDVRTFNPAVSEEMWAVLRRMLAKNPDDRYQNPAELLRALKELPTQSPLRISRKHLKKVERQVPQSPLSPLSDEATRILTAAPPPEEEPPAAPSAPLAPAVPEPVAQPSDLLSDMISDPPSRLGLTTKQIQMAAQQYERAREAQGAGNLEYAQRLLRTCCKVDPTNVRYRHTLRQVDAALLGQKTLGRWLGRVSSLGAKARLMRARNAGEHLKVLEQGEEVLLRNPLDQSTHLDMAASADALGLPRLAVWLLEEARQKDPQYIPFLRQLALLYGKLGEFDRAISLWEAVRKIDPSNPEAPGKINDLAASQTIARGNYKR